MEEFVITNLKGKDKRMKRGGQIVYQPDATPDLPYNAKVLNWHKGEWFYVGYGRYCKTWKDAFDYLRGIDGMESIFC